MIPAPAERRRRLQDGISQIQKVAAVEIGFHGAPGCFQGMLIYIGERSRSGEPQNHFPPPQPYVPMRSHLGAFSGDLPKGDSITEGFYINTIASPMMCE